MAQGTVKVKEEGKLYCCSSVFTCKGTVGAATRSERLLPITT